MGVKLSDYTEDALIEQPAIEPFGKLCWRRRPSAMKRHLTSQFDL